MCGDGTKRDRTSFGPDDGGSGTETWFSRLNGERVMRSLGFPIGRMLGIEL